MEDRLGTFEPALVDATREHKVRVRHCDECLHYDLVCGTNYGGKDDKHCKLGHKPRWYQPKGPMDDDWGHKRRCEDFKEDYV